MADPSDHLLRTFGALPVESRVLDLGCGHGLHTEPLVLLGFDVWACETSPEAVEELRGKLAPRIGEEEAEKRIMVSKIDALGYPDDFFHWVVAYGTLARMETRDDILAVLAEARRVIRPGGWLYVAVPALPEGRNGDRGYAGDSGLEPTFTPRTLDELMVEADFTASERPSVAVQGDRRLVQAIYRRLEPDTPA